LARRQHYQAEFERRGVLIQAAFIMGSSMKFGGNIGSATARTRIVLTVIALAAAGSLGISVRGADVQRSKTPEANNWPLWRGSKLDGISLEQGLPAAWNGKDKTLWRLPLPGPGGSTPAVWDQLIFLTSVEKQDESLVLICANTDGKLLWKREISDSNRDVRGDEGNYASPSPSTDGRHVWAFMGNGDLACYTVGGDKVWQYNVQEKYGKFNIQFGMTSTPVLDRGRLYLQLLHSGGATVLCLDAETGNEIWHQPRPSTAREECEQSYASPIIYRDKDREFLVTHGADCVVAHRLTNGQEIFRCFGLNPEGNYNPTLRFVATPVAAPGLIVVPSAKNGPVLAINPAAEGDITDVAKYHLWSRPNNTPDVPSPLIYDGLVYLCREDGTLICLDAKTGEELYKERAHSDRHRASPVYADGKIYLCARDGTVSVIKAGPKFEVLASNPMEESISSSPAISNGRIYLRTFQALYAIGEQ
jgi:outer membrane protein assembly factor BamB